jgi:hypothetical protein
MPSVLYNQKIAVFTIIPIYSAFVKEMKEQINKISPLTSEVSLSVFNMAL